MTNKRTPSDAEKKEVGADAVGDEEMHLGDFLDGPDGSPPRVFTSNTTSPS